MRCLVMLFLLIPACDLFAQQTVHVEYLVVEDMKWNNADTFPEPTDLNTLHADLWIHSSGQVYHEVKEGKTVDELIEEELDKGLEEVQEKMGKEIEAGNNNVHVNININIEEGKLKRETWLVFEGEYVVDFDTVSQERTMFASYPAYCEPESALKIAWKLFPNQKKKIAGFTCYKAEGDFRGRHYVAWYCPDLPYPYGPWKLHGLPGLILEAYDSKRKVNFLFQSYSSTKEVQKQYEQLSGKVPRLPKDDCIDRETYLKAFGEGIKQWRRKLIATIGASSADVSVRTDEEVKEMYREKDYADYIPK